VALGALLPVRVLRPGPRYHTRQAPCASIRLPGSVLCAAGLSVSAWASHAAQQGRPTVPHASGTTPVNLPPRPGPVLRAAGLSVSAWASHAAQQGRPTVPHTSGTTSVKFWANIAFSIYFAGLCARGRYKQSDYCWTIFSAAWPGHLIIFRPSVSWFVFLLSVSVLQALHLKIQG
jgi:hypothetical protein